MSPPGPEVNRLENVACKTIFNFVSNYKLYRAVVHGISGFASDVPAELAHDLYDTFLQATS